MARVSLAGLLLLLSGTTVLFGDRGGRPAPRKLSIAADLLAPFSAESAKVEGDTVVLLDLRDVPKGIPGRQLAQRVLLDTDDRLRLILWTLAAQSNMARATPFLGQEGPGARLLKPGSIALSDLPPVLLSAPSRLTLIPLDANGAPRQARQVAVRKVRLAGVRCR